jgi:hypothetical protein
MGRHGTVSSLGEADNGFALLCVAQSLPRESLHSPRIMVERIDRSTELPVDFTTFLNFLVEHHDALPVALVFLDERHVPKRHAQKPRNKKQEYHHPRQLVPDAQIDVHCGELSKAANGAKAKYLRRHL